MGFVRRRHHSAPTGTRLLALLLVALRAKGQWQETSYCEDVVQDAVRTGQLPRSTQRKAAQAPGGDGAAAGGPPKYCIWQCAPHKCCPGGYVDKSYFPVVRDSRHKLDAAGSATNVTLVTQATFDRLAAFDALAKLWPGPKVVAFVLHNFTGYPKQHETQSRLLALAAASQKWDNTLAVVLVANHLRQGGGAEVHDDYTSSMRGSGKTLTLYPINTLRNLVVDLAETNWVFPTDVDFAVSATLHHRVSTFMPVFREIDRAAIVIPHFSFSRFYDDPKRAEGVDLSIPTTFQQLKGKLNTGAIIPFTGWPSLLRQELWRLDNVMGGVWSQGVLSTNYSTWYNNSLTANGITAIKIGWMPCGMSIYRQGTQKAPEQHESCTSEYWEPYLLVRRKERSGETLPRYPEAYVGRYFNKLIFASLLRAHRYQFFTLNQEFLVHQRKAHGVTIHRKSGDAKKLRSLMKAVFKADVMRMNVTFANWTSPPNSMFRNGWQSWCSLR